MADSGKMVITLDLESGKFESSLNKSKESLKETGRAGEEALGGLGMHFIAINEALELGQKALEVWHKLLESALESEKIKNQETAFKAFANSLGVNQEALTESIKKSTGGTVTHLQAMNAAMDLLQHGVNARDIPSLTALASTMESVGTHGEKFSDIIRAMANSAEFATGKGLKNYGLIVDKVGSRQEVINAIIEQGKNKFASFGDKLVNTQQKIDVKSKESTHFFKEMWGSLASSVTFGVYADETDRASSRVKALEEQLKSLQKQQAEGKKFFEAGDRSNWIPIEKAIADIQSDIAQKKNIIAEHTKKETEEQKKLNEENKNAKTFALELIPAQKLNSEATANKLALTKRLAEEEKNEGGASLKTIQDLTAAKKLEIEKDFAMKKLAAESGATNEDVLAAELVKIEKDKYDKIRKLRVDDTHFKQAQDMAILRQTETNMLHIENAQAQHQRVMIDSETKRYNIALEKIRTEPNDKANLDKKIEAEEEKHQKEMQRIKDRYGSINMQNLKFGVSAGLDSLKKQQGGFSKFTEDVTTKSQGIMTNAFVEAAKGHGNAMELMKQQFLEMIGTKMINTGTLMFFEGIGEFDPTTMGAGAALIAAGSAIVGASGSSAPSSSISGSGSGPMSPYQNQPTAPTEVASNKQASIIIQGDFLNSRETANHLQDIIRQNSDTTDFTITAQGRSYA